MPQPPAKDTNQHQQFSDWMVAESPLTRAEKVALLRTLAGEPPSRKPTEKQIPDWLQGEFERRGAAKRHDRIERVQHSYVMVAVLFGGGSLLITLLVLAWLGVL